MQNSFRTRKTDYPRTFFLIQGKKGFHLLFWLEHGRDGSVYIWFDDDTDNSWEVSAVHNQKKFSGETKIELNPKRFEIFDPHISWHQSGMIHARGYDEKGKAKQRVISNRATESLDDLFKGATIPVSQIIFPTINANKALKFFGKDLVQFQNPKHWITTLSKSGFHALNNSAPQEGIFIVDESLIPKGQNLGFDIWVCCKGNKPNFSNAPLTNLLYPDTFNINRGFSVTTACIRIFSLPFGDKPENLSHVLATCFNPESVDLFQLKKIKS